MYYWPEESENHIKVENDINWEVSSSVNNEAIVEEIQKYGKSQPPPPPSNGQVTNVTTNELVEHAKSSIGTQNIF